MESTEGSVKKDSNKYAQVHMHRQITCNKIIRIEWYSMNQKMAKSKKKAATKSYNAYVYSKGESEKVRFLSTFVTLCTKPSDTMEK